MRIWTASAGSISSKTNWKKRKRCCVKRWNMNHTIRPFACISAMCYAKQGRMDLAAVEWEKSLNEWHRSLPADLESDKVAEVEKKLNQVKHRVAQKTPATDAKP